jgi:hypothetical protein
MHNNQNNHIKGKFQIEERRRKVASLIAQPMTETEIAKQELSQQFVYDLAKSDLAYYYKQCIDGIEIVLKKGWEVFNNTRGEYDDLSSKDRLQALRVIRECNESNFALFKEGPSIMNVKALEGRLAKIEDRQQQQVTQ